jgi:hypothetical protein
LSWYNHIRCLSNKSSLHKDMSNMERPHNNNWYIVPVVELSVKAYWQTIMVLHRFLGL